MQYIYCWIISCLRTVLLQFGWSVIWMWAIIHFTIFHYSRILLFFFPIVVCYYGLLSLAVVVCFPNYPNAFQPRWPFDLYIYNLVLNIVASMVLWLVVRRVLELVTFYFGFSSANFNSRPLKYFRKIQRLLACQMPLVE